VATGVNLGNPATVREAGDLLGTAMREFAAGRPMPLYLRTARGHRLPHDLAPYFTPPAALDVTERALLALAQGTVLDVGCGPARHARYLQLRGMHALGLDRSAGALAVARALGLRHALHADARAGPLPSGLGTSLLLDGNLGLAGSVQGARQILGRLANASLPGGRLLIGGRAPAGAAARRLVLRVEYRGAVGPWFAWIQLSLTAMIALATSAGWQLETAVETGPRYLACLRRSHWSP
jgi:SAM-dependent methyltransferase